MIKRTVSRQRYTPPFASAHRERLAEKMKTYTDYFDAVTRCLMAFQYLEEALKMVLVRLESLTYFFA